MSYRKLFFLILLLSLGTLSFAADPVIAPMDLSILQSKLKRFSEHRTLPMSDLILKVGLDFLNTPYVAKTLDKTKEEHLVVNLHQLDCTTFAENCLAIARTLKSSHADVGQFCNELEQIRYRDGKMNGYVSRLHYFSEWILDNEKRHKVVAMACQWGGIPFPINLNYMSLHPKEYPQLINDPAATLRIGKIEQEVSAQKMCYIPSSQFESIKEQIQDGDIVTLTTSIPGIDVSHVGMLMKKNGRIYLLHASSSLMKVTVSTEPFAQYLAKSKKTTGLMIARPLDE